MHVLCAYRKRSALIVVAYTHWLKEYSDAFGVHVHAWVFMTNHVHLLCTATDAGGISLMMQSLGRQYVRYFTDNTAVAARFEKDALSGA